MEFSSRNVGDIEGGITDVIRNFARLEMMPGSLAADLKYPRAGFSALSLTITAL